jgi:hypothetical protein
MSTRTPRSIAQILEQVGNTDLRSVSSRGQQLKELERRILASLPAELAGYCRVGGIADGCLLLFATTPAWASRLRFEAPRLQKLLARKGLASIRSVQVRIIPEAESRLHAPRKMRMSRYTARLLEQTARAVQDPRLAQALARLARRGAKE